MLTLIKKLFRKLLSYYKTTNKCSDLLPYIEDSRTNEICLMLSLLSLPILQLVLVLWCFGAVR